jgi:hypothetical protein
MSPLAFFEQLADMPWSMALHESEIAYSIIESVHVSCFVLVILHVHALSLCDADEGSF